MGNAPKIRMALAYKDMSESEFAKALGKTLNSLSIASKCQYMNTGYVTAHNKHERKCILWNLH